MMKRIYGDMIVILVHVVSFITKSSRLPPRERGERRQQDKKAVLNESMAAVEAPKSPPSASRNDHSQVLSPRVLSVLERASSIPSSMFPLSPDVHAPQETKHMRTSSDLEMLTSSTGDVTSLHEGAIGRDPLQDVGHVRYRSIDSSSLQKMLSRATFRPQLTDISLESSADSKLTVPQIAEEPPQGLNSPSLPANEKRLNSLRSLAPYKSTVSSDLNGEMPPALRQNSTISGESIRVGTVTDSAVSGSWSEERAEMAAAQARAQLRARSYFQKAEETYQLQVRDKQNKKKAKNNKKRLNKRTEKKRKQKGANTENHWWQKSLFCALFCFYVFWNEICGFLGV